MHATNDNAAAKAKQTRADNAERKLYQPMSRSLSSSSSSRPSTQLQLIQRKPITSPTPHSSDDDDTTVNYDSPTQQRQSAHHTDDNDVDMINSPHDSSHIPQHQYPLSSSSSSSIPQSFHSVFVTQSASSSTPNRGRLLHPSSPHSDNNDDDDTTQSTKRRKLHVGVTTRSTAKRNKINNDFMQHHIMQSPSPTHSIEYDEAKQSPPWSSATAITPNREFEDIRWMCKDLKLQKIQVSTIQSGSVMIEEFHGFLIDIIILRFCYIYLDRLSHSR